MTFGEFKMPSGWRWLRLDDGRQVFNPRDSAGHLKSYVAAYAYNPADPEAMKPDWDVYEAVRRGSAIEIEITAADIPRDGRVLMQIMREKMSLTPDLRSEREGE